jgi:hypothetical protein
LCLVWIWTESRQPGNYPGALRHPLWQLTIRGRAVERISQRCMGAGSCTVFRNPSHTGSPREAFRKAYINRHPYTSRALGSPPTDCQTDFCSLSSLELLRREPIGPLQIVRAGSSLVCAGNYCGGNGWGGGGMQCLVNPLVPLGGTAPNPRPTRISNILVPASITLVTRR